MLSSSDISALFAQQQASFSQQTAFAQQIGANVPNASLSGWGAPPRSQAPPAMPGIPPPPPAFSYAPQGMAFGYGGGNRVAGSIMSGIGGAASFGGAAVGAMGMIPKFGALGMMDPIGAGIAGYGFGTGTMGMGMAGGIGMGAAFAAPVAAAGYAVSKGIGAFVHGGQQQMMVNSALGQNFGFNNPNARGGAGFTREDASSIGGMIRQISEVPEMMTSMGELTKMIPKLKSMGVMQGVRDATEFSSRFKDAVKTIRDVSKVLGSTMEEASEFFAHSRGVGFTGRQGQLQNVLNAQFTSAQTGMSMGQVMQMQTSGANMATGMGVRRSVGAGAVTKMAQMLQSGVDNKALDQGLLEDITGQQGSAAVGAGAEMFTNVMSQVAKGTSAGRLSMFYLADYDASGKFKGINKERAERLKRGDVSVDEMKRQVGKMSHAQKISATNRIDSMSMEYAGQAGVAGLGSMVKRLAEERGYGEEGAGLILKKYGFSETQSDALLQMAGQTGSGDDMKGFGQQRARESQIRENTDPGAIWRRIKTKMHAKLLGGIEQSGANITTQIGKAWDDFVDDIVGRHVVTMSQQGAKTLSQAFSSREGKEQLRDMFKSASGLREPGEHGSTMGRIIAGAGLLAAAPLTMGQSLGGFGALGALGEGVDRAGRGFMRMMRGAGADSTTGRTAGEQYTAMLDAFGVRKGRGSAAGEAELRKRMGGLMDIGQSDNASIAGGRETVQSMVGGIKGFGDATDAQKLNLLQERIGSTLSGGYNEDRVRLESALNEMERSGALKPGMDKAHALAMAFGSGKGRTDRFNPFNTGDMAGASDSNFLANLDKIKKNAVGSLSKRLGTENSDVVSSLTDKKGFSEAISAAMGGGKNSEAVHAALMADTDSETLRVLKENHIDVDPGDIAALKETYKKVNTKASEGGTSEERTANRKSIVAGITDLAKVNKGTDFKLFQRGMREAAGSMKDGGLKTALRGFADNEDASKFDEKYGDVQKAMESIVARYSGAKTDDERQKILEEAGDLGGRVQSASGRMKMSRSDKALIGKKLSKEELAKKLGTDVGNLKDISDSDLSGGITAEVLKKAKSSATAAELTAGLVGQAKTGVAGDKDQQIIDVLNKLNKTMDLTASTLAISSGILTGKDADKMKEKVQHGLQESGTTDKNGNTVLSHP